MGRRRKKGRAISGWLVLDKPYDFGSTEAVSKLRWLYDANKVGHAGTLDPLATGILPIAFGEATKTVAFVQDGVKRYRFTARWGTATTTDDIEGETIATSQIRPDRAAIEAILPEFIGDIEQVPPAYSAIKVQGERAYDLAREGEEVALAARIISVHDLVLVEMPDQDHAIFEAVTGKGAYVRAIVRDIAEKLGTCGHVSALRRTGVGPFTEEMAVTFDELQGAPVTQNVDRMSLDQEQLDRQLIPIEQAVTDIPAVSLSGGDAAKLQRGQTVVLSAAFAKGVRGDQVGRIEAVLATTHDEAVAICALDGLKLQPSRVFNLKQE